MEYRALIIDDEETYARSLERLLTLDVEIVHAGHDPSFGKQRLREIARGYLSKWDATDRAANAPELRG